MKVEWNSKRLTKKKALFLCWKLWEWLAENSKEMVSTGVSSGKKRWPEWIGNGGMVKHMKLYCPCCEYVRGLKRNCCDNNCLLKSIWPKGCEEEEDSPWLKINYARTPKTFKKYASIIRDAAKAEFEKCK